MPLKIGTHRTLISNAQGVAPRIVSSSSATNPLAGGVTVTVSVPSSVASGNLLVALAFSGTETWTPPAGWTLYGTKAASGNSPQISVFTKTATSTEVAYAFVSTNGLTDATNIIVLNLSGGIGTPSINGMFSSYHASATTAAVTIPGVSAIPSALNCLPIAIDSINQLNLSNAGNPTGLTSGWTGQTLVVNQDTGNFGNTTNNNGYNAGYTAWGPATTNTSTAISAGWTWGGSFSNFTGTSMMLFIAPAII